MIYRSRRSKRNQRRGLANWKTRPERRNLAQWSAVPDVRAALLKFIMASTPRLSTSNNSSALDIVKTYSGIKWAAVKAARPDRSESGE